MPSRSLSNSGGIVHVSTATQQAQRQAAPPAEITVCFSLKEHKTMYLQQIKELSQHERMILMASWPEDFGEVYEIGMKTYKLLFEKHSIYKRIFGYRIDEMPAQRWHVMDEFRQQSLTLMQVRKV